MDFDHLTLTLKTEVINRYDDCCFLLVDHCYTGYWWNFRIINQFVLVKRFKIRQSSNIS